MLRYFVSREFFLTLLALAAAGVLFYLMLFYLLLPAYTRHNKSVVVPDLDKLSLAEAVQKLKDNGLRYEVDSAFQLNVPALTVLEQYPQARERVKPGRKIFITVNRRSVPMVKVPKVIDISLYQAKSRLESWKLYTGLVSYRPDIASKDFVLDIMFEGRRIKAGELVPQGSKIDLIVSKGLTDRLVHIPDLTGLTIQQALAELRRLELGVGATSFNPNSPEESAGRVYSQYPKPVPGDSIRAGSAIDLFIYGKQPEILEGILRDSL